MTHVGEVDSAPAKPSLTVLPRFLFDIKHSLY